MNVDLSTDAPPSPERTLQLADAFAEIVRALNHATRHHEALAYPSEADRLLRAISRAVSMLPQLCDQVAGWVWQEDDAGRIEMASSSRYPNPALAADVVRLRLEGAAADARRLQKSLDAAATVTGDMGAPDDGSE